MCYDCLRPQSHCVCGLVAPFSAHCNILILQHPHERKKYYGTAKIVRKAILNCRLLRGLYFGPEQILTKQQSGTTYLLYPSDNASDCQFTALGREDTVIVLDGTWSEAGKIYRRNGFLQQLPCLSFKSPICSNYQIRKQPKLNYLSTLESIAHMLIINARSRTQADKISSYETLLKGFEKMVNQQLAYFPRSH